MRVIPGDATVLLPEMGLFYPLGFVLSIRSLSAPGTLTDRQCTSPAPPRYQIHSPPCPTTKTKLKSKGTPHPTTRTTRQSPRTSSPPSVRSAPRLPRGVWARSRSARARRRNWRAWWIACRRRLARGMGAGVGRYVFALLLLLWEGADACVRVCV